MINTRLCFSTILALSLCGLGSAQTLVVDAFYDAPDINPGDGVCNDGTGHCTLRAAIMEANALPGDQTILLPAGTLSLTLIGPQEYLSATGDLDLREQGATFTIRGAGQSSTIIDASALGDRVFDNTMAFTVGPRPRLVLEDLTLTGGTAYSTEDGGGILAAGIVHIERCSITGCSSNNRGGAIYGTGQITIIDSELSGNSAFLGGAITVLSAGTHLTMTNCLVTGNSDVARAGGVTTNIDAQLTMDACRITNNSGQFGGLFLAGGSATITGSEISGNTGGTAGIYFQGGTKQVENCTFHNNASTGNGPTITNYGADLTLIDCTITANSASGIAIGGAPSPTLALTRCTISDNMGGAMSGAGTILATDCNFERNVTVRVGSALWLAGGSATLNHCLIADNSTSYRGTFAVDPGGSLDMTACALLRNTASDWGGSAVLTYGTTSMTDCEVRENTGGLFAPIAQFAGTLSLARCNVEQNSASYSGAVFNYGGSVFIDECSIHANQQAIGGGQGTGGIYGRVGSHTIVTTSTLSGNTCGSGGGAALVGGAAVIEFRHCTIVGNHSDLGPGGILCFGAAELTHTILARNTSTTLADGEASGGVFTSNGYNLIGDGSGLAFLPGTGDLVGTTGAALDPLLGPLADNGGPTLTHEPLLASPVIDAGNNVGAPLTDQRSLARIVDGDSDTIATIDIGSVEFDEPDSDADGLPDSVETNTGVYVDATDTGTDPNNPDSDGDGALDGCEVELATANGTACPNPLNPDSDGDLVSDGTELNCDGAAPCSTNPCSPDTDADGLTDAIDPDPCTPSQNATSQLEIATRALADINDGFALPLFTGPNANSKAGRRGALSNRLRDAANAIAVGQYQAAVDSLTSALEKLDEQHPSPDWMVPSVARDALATALVELIGQLLLL